MIVYFVRHGETEYNRKRLVQGMTDIPLNDTGLGQAGKAAAWFRKRNITFDRVYSSPLTRAMQTAETISGWDRSRIIKEPRIQELNFGTQEGVLFFEMDQKVKNLFQDPVHFEPAPGGETIEELQTRCRSFLDEMVMTAKAHPEIKTVLAASHGACFRGLVSCLTNSRREDFWIEGVGNCAVMTVNVTEDGCELAGIEGTVEGALEVSLSKGE